jgi:uncharacterized damage-inducible protein DinB
MFTSIEQFKKEWQSESDATRKIFSTLTDKSLKQPITSDHRTLGRIAWHIVNSIPHMANKTGLHVEGPDKDIPVPSSADEIKQAYDKAAQSLENQVSNNWNDESLQIEDNLFGEKWKRRMSLFALIKHQIHHRGQMTILMRQAELQVQGIYGPTKEEWTAYGMPVPKI